MKSILVLFSLVAIPLITQAEPWLANRFAKNCAACHGSSRINQPVMKRSCTLTCQGCHTNPNGGGLRNHYGTWNQKRWLKSFSHNNKAPRPKPWFQENYVKKEQKNELLSYLGEKSFIHASPHPAITKNGQSFGNEKLQSSPPPASQPEITHKKELDRVVGPTAKKQLAQQIKQAPRPMTAEAEEWLYSKYNGDIYWLLEAKNDEEFESRMPEDDPYFKRKQGGMHAGLEFRYQYFSDREQNREEFWPMSFDVSAEYRGSELFGYEEVNHLAAVVEARFANFPGRKDIDQQFTSQSQVRSAYVIADRLPLNSYVMHGLYRPMFETYNPDHNALAQQLIYGSSLDAYSFVNRATTIGLAPNIPFLNVTLLQGANANSIDQEEGHIINIGGRWITLGASLVYSYWDSKERDTQFNKTMHNIAAGWNLWRWTGNLEATSIEREFEIGSFDKGTVTVFDNRFRVWRENYIETSYSKANTDIALKEGDSTQYSVGLRSFHFNFLETALAYRETDSFTVGTGSTKNRQILFQLHGYLY